MPSATRADHKSATLSTLKFADKNMKWKKIMFRACLKIKHEHSILKITIKHSQTEIGFVLDCRLWVFLFLLVATFLIITFSMLLLSLHMYTQTRHVSSNFLPLVSVKPTVCFFNSLLIPGDQTKNLSDVMAAYLIYRYIYVC